MDVYNSIEKLIADQHGKTLGTRKAIGDFMRWTPLVGQPTGLIKIVLQAARGTLPWSRAAAAAGAVLDVLTSAPH